MKTLILLAFMLILNMFADDGREIISGNTTIVIDSYQETMCGDKSLSHCIYHFAKQCNNGKNYVACSIVGSLQDSQERYGDAKKHYERVCEMANSKDTFEVESIDGKVSKISAIKAMQTSCYHLGTYYHYGTSVEKNYQKALQYYKKTCDLGNSDACDSARVEMGNIHLDTLFDNVEVK